MAQPVGFDGSNGVIYGEGGIRDLPVHIAREPSAQIISCWRLSPEELKQVAETGVVWLSIYATNMAPVAPVFVSGDALVKYEDGRPSKAEPILPDPPKSKDGLPFKART